MSSRANLAIGLVLLLAALSVPAWGSDYQLTFLVELFRMLALAQAWNLISGMTGYVSFGHAAFFGIGAYAGALMLVGGLPWYLAMVGGGVIAMLISLPLGILTLRLRGPYFASALLGLNELGRIIATLWVDLTSGGDGIALAPSLLPSLTTKYLAMLSLTTLAMVGIALVHKSRFGLELRAIREGEDAAEMVGVNTTRNKVIAFVLSATLPGMVGAVDAMVTSYIDPASVFDPALNVQMIVMVLLGGSGTLWGPAIGAGIVKMLHELFWAQFPALHLALLGGLLIAIILYLPDGILSIIHRKKRIRPDQIDPDGTDGPADSSTEGAS